MSVFWKKYVKECSIELSLAQASAYHVLAWFARDPDDPLWPDQCWPSLKAIAAEMHSCLNTARYAVRHLVKVGLLDIVATGNGARNCTLYRLKFAEGEVDAPNVLLRKGAADAPFVLLRKGAADAPNVSRKGAADAPLKDKLTALKTRQGESSGFAAAAGEARPSQATARPPSKSASHHEPNRKAALWRFFRRPTSPPKPPQMALPIAEASATPPTPVSARNSGTSERTPNSAFTPRDPRFDEVANEIRKLYWPVRQFGPCPWGSAEKSALSRLLADNPGIDLQRFKHMLHNRADSVNAGEYNASEMPRDWLRKLPSFASGPINRFGDPLVVKRDPGIW